VSAVLFLRRTFNLIVSFIRHDPNVADGSFLEPAIVEGKIKPGERLPSEREMQIQFGTGRGVVREALKILKQKGVHRSQAHLPESSHACPELVRQLAAIHPELSAAGWKCLRFPFYAKQRRYYVSRR